MKFIDFEKAKERLKTNVGEDYTLIDFTEGKYSVSKIRHDTCGHEYKIQNKIYFSSTRPASSGTCPVCSNFGKYSIEQVQKIINEKIGDETYVVKKYTNKREKILIHHTSCNSDIELYLGNIQKGQRCPICSSGFKRRSESMKYTTEKFKQVVSEKFNNRFDFVGEYTDYNTHSQFKCNICNSVFLSTPNNFIKEGHCPVCSATAGEQKIMELLEKENIIYEFQKPIKIDSKNYRYDFFIPNKNIFIEYDGKQHFKPGFGKTEAERENNLKLTRKRDLIKNQYCKDNNFKLIRIAYTEFNKIHDILLENEIISSTTIENTSNDGSE